MSFVTLAARLIDKNGRDMVLREMVSSGPSYNPTLTPVDHDVVGVVTEYKLSQLNDIIKVGDKQILMAASAAPNAAMKLIDDGIEFEIVNVFEIKPANNTIMHKVHVRR